MHGILGIQFVRNEVGCVPETFRAQGDQGGGEETPADIAGLLAEQFLAVQELVSTAAADAAAALFPHRLGIFSGRNRHAGQGALLEAFARSDIQVPDSLRQAEGMDDPDAGRAVAFIVEVNELDHFGIGPGGPHEDAHAREVFPVAGGLLQQLNGDFHVARALVHRDHHVGERRQRHGKVQPELRRADGCREPLDVGVVAKGGRPVQEFSLERLNLGVEHLECIVDRLHVLVDERAKFIEIAKSLLAGFSKADEKGRTGFLNIAQRFSLGITGDVRKVDGMQLRLVLPELVERQFRQVEHADTVSHGGKEGRVAVDPVAVA